MAPLMRSVTIEIGTCRNGAQWPGCRRGGGYRRYGRRIDSLRVGRYTCHRARASAAAHSERVLRDATVDEFNRRGGNLLGQPGERAAGGAVQAISKGRPVLNTEDDRG